jgi:hypothetical protein
VCHLVAPTKTLVKRPFHVYRVSCLSLRCTNGTRRIKVPTCQRVRLSTYSSKYLDTPRPASSLLGSLIPQKAIMQGRRCAPPPNPPIWTTVRRSGSRPGTSLSRWPQTRHCGTAALAVHRLCSASAASLCRVAVSPCTVLHKMPTPQPHKPDSQQDPVAR